MNKREASLSDFLWGDTDGLHKIGRDLLKVAVALVAAFMLYEFFAHVAFHDAGNWSEVEQSFAQANDELAKLSKQSPGADVIRICLTGTWTLAVKSLACPVKDIEHVTSKLGYRVLSNDVSRSTDPGRSFFEVKGFISSVHIVASTETMLREVESVAFNPPGTPDVALQLCTGSRETAPAADCGIVAQAREKLSTTGSSLDELINTIRIRALFVGPFQFCTLAVFIFVVIETFGLWTRWVRPKAKLYKTQPGGAIDPGSVREITEDNVRKFLDSRDQSIGDKMLYQVLVASEQLLRFSDDGGTVASSKSSSAPLAHSAAVISSNDLELPEESRGPSEVPPPAASNLRRSSISATLDAYRRYLLDDAVARQESLETLGDTMLKLAFMGTVYGISAALFAARGLDTANPVLKLLSKAEMYSGIGTGFGTTLTGIILSIIAAQFRSFLFGEWSEKIGRTYELILDFDATGLLALAFRLRARGVDLSGRSPTESAYEKKGVDFPLLVGILVVIGLLFAVFLHFIKGFVR